MSSIAKIKSRSKKTKRLWPAQIIRPQQYENFDMNSKVECIQALIPLGLMQIHELLETEVCALAGARYERKGGLACRVAGLGAMLGVFAWRDNGIRASFRTSNT